jgi:cystathionine beta-lyase
MEHRVTTPPLEVLRRRRSVKWRLFEPDVLPMFVAEMDHDLAPAVTQALQEALALGDTGYADTDDRALATAFAGFARDAWGWEPDPARIVYATDVSVVVVESLRRLIEPGDRVVVTPPVYPPFYRYVPEAGGAVVEVPLRAQEDHRFRLDLDGIEQALADGARAVLLCNPHNPTGTVHPREDLVALADLVDRHGAVVVSDEIHAPLTHQGRTFTPYLDVSDAARDHGLAATSVSKAFNLAGLKTAMFVAASGRMARLVDSLPHEVGARVGHHGMLASLAGLSDGRDWLDAVVTTVERNVVLLGELLAERLPAARLHPPDATYLAWLDLSALGWGDDPAVHALREARVALGSGPTFGAGGAGHARMTLACSPEVLEEAVARLAAATA